MNPKSIILKNEVDVTLRNTIYFNPLVPDVY